MRVFSHTCSNTEIVCALGCADLIVGIDTDSDYPVDVVAQLPKLGRDLDLDVAGVIALQPDLVLTSLTVPGHERIVAELEAAGLRILVCDPCSLEDIYHDIRRIAAALGVGARGDALIAEMRAAMPPLKPTAAAPKVLIEWWPKPVITPTRQSWATDLIALAGGENPWAHIDAKSAPLTDAQVLAASPDVVVMSWCGVREENYRADIVRRRAGWSEVPAVKRDRIVPITEAWLGRPGPRLVEGYRALRGVIAAAAAD
ncbi:MAG: transporter substrate-binding protein [Nevskia sp.]|nr:transporter substrate-binding protein [Nevskia sp.]